MDYVMTVVLVTPVRAMALTGTLKKNQRDLRALAEIVWDLKRKDSVAIINLDWRDVTRTPDVPSDRVQMRFKQGKILKHFPFFKVLIKKQKRREKNLNFLFLSVPPNGFRKK